MITDNHFDLIYMYIDLLAWSLALFGVAKGWFLARLHFSAEELLLYSRRQHRRRRPCRRPRPHAEC